MAEWDKEIEIEEKLEIILEGMMNYMKLGVSRGIYGKIGGL